MDASDATEPERQLPTAVQLHILSLLTPNDRALSGRLVSPDAAAGLSGPQHCTATLSQPLPPHAVPWAVEAGQQHVRQLPFRLKPLVLCTAVASGSKVNLEIAWESLQPSVFPEQQFKAASGCPDPGVAAVRAGHPQLLGWLAQYCPELLSANGALQAAAQLCDLAGLQAAWEAVLHIVQVNNFGDSITMNRRVFNAAAESATGDAVAKMEWLLSTAGYSLHESTAAAAARSGDVGRLRWLRERGCPMGQGALESALRHADLAVAQWLVDEAGCELPAPAEGPNFSGWHRLLQAAVQNSDGIVKLQWLRERGGPLLQNADGETLRALLYLATGAGQAEVLRHLLALVTPGGDGPVQTEPYAYGNAAAASGSIPTAQLLLQAGARFTRIAYKVAYDKEKGHEAGMAMIRWLATEAGLRVASVGTLIDLVKALAWKMAGSTAGQAGMVEAVQLAVGEGTHNWATAENPASPRGLMHEVINLGNLGLAQFLVPFLGFKPVPGTLDKAARGGCEALLKWLVEQHPGRLEGDSPYVCAAKDGDRATLAALRRLGVTWGPGDTAARAVVSGCPVPALRWLVEQGAPVGSELAMEGALRDVPGKYDSGVEDWLRGLARAGGAGEEAE